jgi:DNA-binding MarR family transcriptional regulator
MRPDTLQRARPKTAYSLDEQVGFLLRQVMQRHAAIFAARVDNAVTATQWAALAKLSETGAISQNALGRLTVMDAATIKGVVERLTRRALTRVDPDPDDARRRLVSLTEAGHALVRELTPVAAAITEETVSALNARERAQLKGLLKRLR